jgi:hypothetical protein
MTSGMWMDLQGIGHNQVLGNADDVHLLGET